jgi:beta-galactosidase
MGWFWARDPDGSPEDRLEGELSFFDPGLAGAYAGSNNMQPHVSNEVTQVMFDLNSFSEEIIALREQRRPIRLFYSETTAININDYMTKAKKLYEKLFFEGFPIGFATKNIIEKQDNSEWDLVVVYRNDYVTDAEFNAMQTYLDNGGTVLLDSKNALSMNEYGQKRKTLLAAGKKGKLIVADSAKDLAKIKTLALAEIDENNVTDVVVKEDNGLAHKTSTWRVVKNDDGSYVVNILNLGHNTAKLSVSLKNGKSFTVTDMMTSNKLDSTFELASEGVLLLEVKPK